jgi:hypothetical protein
MFGILLRPPLMVLGFFMAFILMAAIGPFLGFGLNLAFATIIDGHTAGVVTLFALIIISSTFLIIVAHKIFALTTWLADNAMRWMGQQIQNLGEGGETRQMGGIIAGHVGTAGATARMAGSGSPSTGATNSLTGEANSGSQSDMADNASSKTDNQLAQGNKVENSGKSEM